MSQVSGNVRFLLRKIEEILRLKFEVGLSHRAIAQFTPDAETPDTLTPPTGEKWTSYYYAGGQRIAMRVQDPASTIDTNAVYYPLTDNELASQSFGLHRCHRSPP